MNLLKFWAVPWSHDNWQWTSMFLWLFDGITTVTNFTAESWWNGVRDLKLKISQQSWIELWPLPLCSLAKVSQKYFVSKWNIFHMKFPFFAYIFQVHLAIWALCVLLILLICVSDSWQLQFIPSEFRGQLPKPFAEGPLATRSVPTDMNDQNLEEPSRYVRA